MQDAPLEIGAEPARAVDPGIVATRGVVGDGSFEERVEAVPGGLFARHGEIGVDVGGVGDRVRGDTVDPIDLDRPHRFGPADRLPGPRERREHLVGRPRPGLHRVGRHGVVGVPIVHGEPLGREGFTNGIVSTAAVGPEVVGGIDGLGPGFGGEIGQHGGRVTGSDHEVAVHRPIETRQRVREERQPRRARRDPQGVVVHEHADDRAGGRRVGQGPLVGESEVAAEPEDGRRGVLSHRTQSSSRRARMKVSGGISTRPMAFIRFLPSFCLLSSLFLRVTSPP